MYPLWTLADAIEVLPDRRRLEAINPGSRSMVLAAVEDINELVERLSGCRPDPVYGVNLAALRALIGEYRSLTLREIVEALEAEQIRRNIQPSSAERKTARKGQYPRKCKNAARDAWVARQRDKKEPPGWDEIFDEGVRLSARRGWDMPGSAKALEEAHRRYLSRQRKSKAKVNG